jgi:ribonuclease D
VAGLDELRGISVRALGDGGRGLVDAVRKGLAVPEADLPRIAQRPRTAIDVEGVVELMGALVRVRAREHGVAVPLLATRSDLERLASGERDECPLLQGWRKTLVGDALVELAEGRLSLRVLDGAVVPKPVGEDVTVRAGDEPGGAAADTAEPPDAPETGRGRRRVSRGR